MVEQRIVAALHASDCRGTGAMHPAELGTLLGLLGVDDQVADCVLRSVERDGKGRISFEAIAAFAAGSTLLSADEGLGGAEEALLEPHEFDFVKASYLRTVDALPEWKECVQEGALIKRTVSLGDAITGRLAGSMLAVSHRWVEPASPDPSNAQMRALKTHLAAHPKVEEVWVDWSCLPQGERNEAQQRFFDRCLQSVNLLYLALRVLVIADSAYLSRFWTQFECLLSMRRIDEHGLTPLPEAERRVHFRVVGIESGNPGLLVEILKRRWGNNTIEEALRLLAEEDVQVTNGRDKIIQLEKLSQLHASTSTLFAAALRRLRPDERAAWEMGKQQQNRPSKHMWKDTDTDLESGCIQRSSWSMGAELKRGKLGMMYTALYRKSAHLFAVKEVHMAELAPHEAETLMAEVMLYQEAKHPNLVMYLGHEVSEQRLFLYFEHMPCGSVEQMLADFGPLEEETIRLYLRGVLAGLSYLHAWDPPVVHCNVRGSNVYIGLQGEAKLADFNCAARAASKLTDVKGSIPWMAPEVINGSGYGPSADVWSFGCLAIEQATAQPPWGHFDNAIQAMTHIGKSSEVPPVPKTLSEAAFVNWCLNRECTARPTAAQLQRDV